MVLFYRIEVQEMASTSSKHLRRSVRLCNTSVKPKNTASCLPFLDAFLAQVVAADDNFISTTDLQREYVSHVRKLTRDKKAIFLAESKNRFSKTMKREAAKRKWIYVAGPERGYRLGLKGRVQRKQPTAPNQKVSSPPEVVFIDGTKGNGLFATTDYQAGEIICPYYGQIIGRDEKVRREAEYERQGLSYRIVDLPGGRFLDGARDKDGTLFNDLSHNLGSAANHSFSSPNCRLQQTDGEFVLISTTGIHKGAEICWFYGDTRKNLPGCSWLFD